MNDLKKHKTKMKKENKGRRVSPEALRSTLGEMVDAICSSDRPVMVVAGNTFEIHLEDAVVNIAFHQRRRRRKGRDGRGGQAKRQALTPII